MHNHDDDKRLEYDRDFPQCRLHGLRDCEDCNAPLEMHAPDLELEAAELMAEHMGRIELLAFGCPKCGTERDGEHYVRFGNDAPCPKCGSGNAPRLMFR